MKKNLLLLFFLLLIRAAIYAQSSGLHDIHGKVTSAADHSPLAGVNIIVKGSTQGTTTDANGDFDLKVESNSTLLVSFIGYSQVELAVNSQTRFDIVLQEDISTLGEITIVSTGYQQLSKERVNGSFVQLDNQLLNRRVGTDLLSRLEDVTSGVIFNRNVPGKKNDFSVRGISTINSQAQPLIVIDHFPYEGDINTLNPNDVESVTVLKDAAAASIWGARAGNGVIVITTRKGNSGQPLKVSFNSNITIAGRPDLFYESRMSSGQLIESERRLFSKGFYEAAETSVATPLTPAVELMIANRDGQLSDEQLESQLASLSTHDVRNDFNTYLYRKSVNQQYALSLQGGTVVNKYYFAVGWDKNQDNLVGNEYDRVTLNFNNSWLAFSDRLTINAGIYYSANATQTNNSGPSAILFNQINPLYSYASLADANGNPIPITKDYRLSFIRQAQSDGLLNWDYSPLDELQRADNNFRLNEYRINTTLNYKIMEGLNAEVLYQYWRGNGERRALHNENTYFARNLINRFSAIDADGVVTRAIPSGGILDLTHTDSENNSIRGQLNFNRTFGAHAISALTGYEVRELNTDESTARNYGYNDQLATTTPVNYINYFQYYDSPFSGGAIPYVDNQSSQTDRYVSYYANASYTYQEKYSISGSARRDQSNLFGVRANQRTVPLWSTGLGWTISEEKFFKAGWLPYLKLRTTYGSNGNINKSTTAFTTAYHLGFDQLTGLPYSVIQNSGNPDLRWERVNIYNAGLDFELRNRRLYGSLEFYTKSGKDLIGTSPFASSSGVTSFTGNFASIRSRGVDVVLNSVNIDRQIKWRSTLLLSAIREQVTTYKTETPAYALLENGTGATGFVAPREGKPLYAVYSYAWAGLDPETGNPRSFVNGIPSSDYSTITINATPQSLVYHGAARPTTFGSLRNTVSYKNIALSFNISYRLGYYFRKQSVLYNQVLSGYSSHGDYGKRWQQPGDERFTNVPSLPEAYDYNRESIYIYSDALVQKGDHIRMQDITLNYTIHRSAIAKSPFSKIEVYSYVNNLGIIWKSATGSTDPDYPTLKPVRSIALGLRLEF